MEILEIMWSRKSEILYRQLKVQNPRWWQIARVKLLIMFVLDEAKLRKV